MVVRDIPSHFARVDYRESLVLAIRHSESDKTLEIVVRFANIAALVEAMATGNGKKSSGRATLSAPVAFRKLTFKNVSHVRKSRGLLKLRRTRLYGKFDFAAKGQPAVVIQDIRAYIRSGTTHVRISFGTFGTYSFRTTALIVESKTLFARRARTGGWNYRDATKRPVDFYAPFQ